MAKQIERPGRNFGVNVTANEDGTKTITQTCSVVYNEVCFTETIPDMATGEGLFDGPLGEGDVISMTANNITYTGTFLWQSFEQLSDSESLYTTIFVED